MYERDIVDESSNRHYKSTVSEWSNPLNSNIKDPAFGGGGTWGTETSKYPEEYKSYDPSILLRIHPERSRMDEIPLVAASERGTV